MSLYFTFHHLDLLLTIPPLGLSPHQEKLYFFLLLKVLCTSFKNLITQNYGLIGL